MHVGFSRFQFQLVRKVVCVAPSVLFLGCVSFGDARRSERLAFVGWFDLAWFVEPSWAFCGCVLERARAGHAARRAGVEIARAVFFLPWVWHVVVRRGVPLGNSGCLFRREGPLGPSETTQPVPGRLASVAWALHEAVLHGGRK
jgi:hypothetical protein